MSLFADFEFGDNPLVDIGVPILFSFLLIFLNFLYPAIFFLGTPFAFEGDAVYGALVAAPSEEVAFRFIVLGGLSIFIGPAAVPVQAVAFSLFHWATYGVGLSAAFIGALLVGLFNGIWVFQRKSFTSLLGVTIEHAIFNAFLALTAVVVLPTVL